MNDSSHKATMGSESAPHSSSEHHTVTPIAAMAKLLTSRHGSRIPIDGKTANITTMNDDEIVITASEKNREHRQATNGSCHGDQIKCSTKMI